MDTKILILGSDANAYYMARCAYEYTHKKAHLIGKDRLAFTKFSNILTIEYEPNLWNEQEFVRILNRYALKNIENRVLVISTNETYSLFLARNQKILEHNLVYFKQSAKVLETLTNKEKFYKTYKTSSLSFQGKNKIYKIESEEELLNTINRIKSAGYQEKLILQEYIPGDDSYLFDSVVYVSKSGKVKVISFAQIGLQERSKSMVGNAACLINGFNTFKVDTSNMKENIITFMETLGMNGFFEFDMKYDKKSNTFKVLEINARQGRCSYYLTPLKANLVEIMLKDLVLQEELPFRDLKEECLLSFVPKNIVKTYITNEDFKKEVLRLWKKRVSPMECPKDKNFKRFLMMKKRLWHYKKEYQNSYWKA